MPEQIEQRLDTAIEVMEKAAAVLDPVLSATGGAGSPIRGFLSQTY